MRGGIALYLALGLSCTTGIGCGSGQANRADASSAGGSVSDAGGTAGVAGGAGGGAGAGGSATGVGGDVAGTGGAAGASGTGGQISPPCTQTIIDLPGTAEGPPTLVPTSDGLAVVWANANDHTIQGGRIVNGAFADGWTSTFTVLSTSVPAIWNGTDLALTYINRDSNIEGLSLITVGANGAITSGPFPLPINSGLPVAVAWNGSTYGVAWSDLTTVTFALVGTDGTVHDSQVLTGLRSPPSVQWDGDAWLIASAMIWTINEPARLDVMRIAANGTSLGKQSAPTTGANRAAQVTEIGGSIFATFGTTAGVQFARFDRALGTAPFVTPLPSLVQMGALGIAARGATLGIAVITHPSTLGLNTYFLEVDQNGQPVRSTQLLGSNPMGTLAESPVSIVGTTTGWAIGWEDFTNNYFDGRVSLLDCH